MDVDGTLTDGKVYIGNDGEFIKAFNIKDGYAIVHLLSKHDIIPVIITGKKSEIVSKRCQELGINFVFQNVSNKREKMIAEKKGCPADAVNEIKAVSDFVSSKNSGDGAVREFVEWVCEES